MNMIARDSDVLIVEGVGGIMVPMDAKHTMLDVARWLKLPAVVVARPNLGTINHTLLTVDALRGAKVKVAGVVINRYPAETARRRGGDQSARDREVGQGAGAGDRAGGEGADRAAYSGGHRSRGRDGRLARAHGTGAMTHGARRPKDR